MGRTGHRREQDRIGVGERRRQVAGDVDALARAEVAHVRGEGRRAVAVEVVQQQASDGPAGAGEKNGEPTSPPVPDMG